MPYWKRENNLHSKPSTNLNPWTQSIRITLPKLDILVPNVRSTESPSSCTFLRSRDKTFPANLVPFDSFHRTRNPKKSVRDNLRDIGLIQGTLLQRTLRHFGCYVPEYLRTRGVRSSDCISQYIMTYWGRHSLSREIQWLSCLVFSFLRQLWATKRLPEFHRRITGRSRDFE